MASHEEGKSTGILDAFMELFMEDKAAAVVATGALITTAALY